MHFLYPTLQKAKQVSKFRLCQYYRYSLVTLVTELVKMSIMECFMPPHVFTPKLTNWNVLYFYYFSKELIIVLSKIKMACRPNLQLRNYCSAYFKNPVIFFLKLKLISLFEIITPHFETSFVPIRKSFQNPIQCSVIEASSIFIVSVRPK